MAKVIEDLRFFIGFFFFIVGALLMIEGLRNEVLVEGFNLNLITGIGFIIFSLGAAALVMREHRPVAGQGK